jgi:hypothetical protein
MKPIGLIQQITRAAGLLWIAMPMVCRAAEGGTAAAATNSTASAEEPADFRNWVELTTGYVFVDGDKPAFQRRHSRRGDAPFGGIEDFHFERDVGKRGLFTLDGRGIFDNHDYGVRLQLSHPDKGYVRAGYREFRTWYDGSGGFFPLNGQWISLYDEDLAIDRGEAFFEGGLTLPDLPEFRFKYTHEFRRGLKDSTSWGDTALTGVPGPNNIRGIVPTFWNIDETRDIFEGDVKHSLGNTAFGVGLRYEISDQDNSRNIHRRPGELPPAVVAPGTDRFITQHEGVDADLFNVHGFTETRFNEKILFTSGASYTTLDTDVSGSRIYGNDYDPVYDPVYLRRQQRDEGFLNLGGGSQLRQCVFNLNLMITPWDDITVVPFIRVERQDQDGFASFLETDVGAGPGFVASSALIENTRERGLTDVSEGLECRYSGLSNWAFYARAELLQGDGTLKERETEAQTGLVSRDTDSTRFTQKYTVGANWYPLRRLSMGAQYYFKSRKNEYDHILDSTTNAPPSADRYPAYLRDQNFSTHDLNYRVTWRPFVNVTLISRYDFQLSTIDTRADFLAEQQSAENTAHIFSQSISWTPFARLSLQASINYVLDQTDTPAAEATLSTNIVLNAKNNYWNGSFLAGLALTEKTDFQAQYLYYRANNYADNSAFGQPYGAGAEEHGASGALIHRFTKRLQVSLRYGFFTGHDQTSGGQNDYTAHLVSSNLRMNF